MSDLFEAIVTEVDYENYECTLNPLSVSSSSPISNVPIPIIGGINNAGIFHGLGLGTRVIAANTTGRGRTNVAIISIVPKSELIGQAINTTTDVPVGTLGYPELSDGEIILRGLDGQTLSLSTIGDIELDVNGSGLFINKVGAKTSIAEVAEDKVSYTSSGKTISGSARRISAVARNMFPKDDISETPVNADTKYASISEPIGFFRGSMALDVSYSSRLRNPAITEYRAVINEFAAGSYFTGFDDEVERVTGIISLFDKRIPEKYYEQGNTLDLAPHELVEVIGGNVLDINGNILDINYSSLSYGGPKNTVPRKDLKIEFDRANKISRRGIGYHFQLAKDENKFLFDIDKEGFAKISLGKTSDTGNIPFASKPDFGNLTISYLNESKRENIPVTLRDENGEIVYPKVSSVLDRYTGIRFSNTDESPYFPAKDSGHEDPIRVSPTRYHNMYATAERLIANSIKFINIPNQFIDDNNMPEDLAYGKPFEVPTNSESIYTNSMSVIAVSPDPPAIYTGGDTVVAGQFYSGDSNSPYSNSFESSLDGDRVVTSISDDGDYRTPTGGKSMHFGSDGSIEASIGKDNYDQKSIVLDTDGSIVSWVGKDRNNRSIVTQTDGDVLLNIGGSYGETFNKGKLEIRVNVTDKGFVTTEYNGDNPGVDSDYIISISENGIVIAGAKANTPMIIRNEGSILIESASGDLTLKGTQVKIVEPKGRANTVRSSGR